MVWCRMLTCFSARWRGFAVTGWRDVRERETRGFLRRAAVETCLTERRFVLKKEISSAVSWRFYDGTSLLAAEYCGYV